MPCLWENTSERRAKALLYLPRKEEQMKRNEVIATIRAVKNACEQAEMVPEAIALTMVLDSFESMVSTAGAILGAKGGKVGGRATSEAKTLANREKSNIPPKEGKRPRGRPRKEITNA
jgi:hypothetical protein